MAISVVLGIFVGIVGLFISTPLLKLIRTDAEVLPLASLYLKIYFLGVPATIEGTHLKHIFCGQWLYWPGLHIFQNIDCSI